MHPLRRKRCFLMRCAACVQDNVPAFESAQAVAIVERNLGGPIGTYFDSFDMTPFAAASLGQVRLDTPMVPTLTVAHIVRTACACLAHSNTLSLSGRDRRTAQLS